MCRERFKLCMSLLHVIIKIKHTASFKKLPHALRGKQDKLSKTLGICHLKYHVHCNSPINHILKKKMRKVRIGFASAIPVKAHSIG